MPDKPLKNVRGELQDEPSTDLARPVAAGIHARRPLPLGRTVTANLDRVSPRAALSLVARAGGGTLNLPADLTQSVTLVANDTPVEQALDDLTRQAGAAWSVTYVIKGAATPPPAPQPAP